MTDTLTVRLVVLILGEIATVALGGVVYLTAIGTPADRTAVVGTIAAGALGALSAVLVSTRSGTTDGPA